MKIIYLKYILTIMCVFSTLLSFARENVSLCGEWSFALEKDFPDKTDWLVTADFGKKVSVPHTWNVEDGIERVFGKAWYARKFNVPLTWNKKQVRVHFDAAYRDAVIYINGKKIGEHIGSGYTEFSFDISSYLNFGSENLICVSVDNRFSEYAFPYKEKFDWPNDGGIIRPVELIVTERPSIRYARVRSEINFEKKSASIQIEIKNWETGLSKVEYHYRIKEWKSGKEVLNEIRKVKIENEVCKVMFDLNDIKLWHFDDPNLYMLEVEAINKGKVTDTYSTRFGFRKVEVIGNQLFLNKELVRLPGIEYMPGSYPEFGMAEPLHVMEKAVDLMKELNCVITRCHWQYDKRYFDLLDEKGILAQEEIPWWQAPGNLSPEMEKLAKSQISEMIERDFNHPSIISWGVSNEVFNNTDKDVYRRLVKYAKDFQSDRLITVVSNLIFERLENDESLIGDIPTWNDYIGTWHGKNREETPEKLDIINKRALKGRPLLITEHGLCEPRFVGADPRRTTEMTYHYDQWAKHDYIIGAIYFSLNDYRTHVGEAGYGRYKSRVHGLTSMWFDKKPSFNIYKGLASPVYVENLQIKASGKEADLTLKVKNDLPSYILRNYVLEWQTVEGTKQLTLPELKPGDKFDVKIDGLSPKSCPKVKILRPTGFIVTEY
ncbi:MAG: glycoside hydrolase family 2 TIM barrel-domain containing protein [Paludibacter sp.]|nr:glycoside hydrolase family 2 TIM barrel-domain containing protein [Paludibacter sp.]